MSFEKLRDTIVPFQSPYGEDTRQHYSEVTPTSGYVRPQRDSNNDFNQKYTGQIIATNINPDNKSKKAERPHPPATPHRQHLAKDLTQ